MALFGFIFKLQVYLELPLQLCLVFTLGCAALLIYFLPMWVGFAG